MSFAENVRKLRLEKGLTQAELGEKIFVAQPTVRNYEQGKIEPRPNTLVRLARALDTTVEQLLKDQQNEVRKWNCMHYMIHTKQRSNRVN